MSRPELRIAGGRVLLPDGSLAAADVLVGAGRIAGLCGPGERWEAAETVAAEGLVVLPGAVDAHVHLGQDITFPQHPEDVTLETDAAAAGGVTTLLAYLMTTRPYGEVLGEVVPLMESAATIDFGLHCCIVSREQLAELPSYVEELGVSSFKFFMNFRGEEGAYLGLPGNDDGFLLELMRAAAATGAMVNPHAENVELIWARREGGAPEGLSPLASWNWLRPAYAEAEALQRAASLARVAGASMYAVHVTSAEALESLARQRGPRLHLETCPHYLTHDVDCGLDSLAKVNPPLRQAADREALWRALAEGTIEVVGSDHVPRHVDAKHQDILAASAGFPGLQTLLPVLLSEGHLKRGIPLARIAAAVAANPARLFGLYPRKGAVAVGADADLALVDLASEQSVSAATQHSGAGYSIYEGWRLGCRVVHTLVGGRFALRDGELTGARGGRYLARPRSGGGEPAL